MDIFGARIDDRRRQEQRVNYVLKEAAAFGQRVDQVNMRPFPAAVLEQDSEHHAWKAGAGAEIGPGPGLRPVVQQLRTVERMARPEIREGCGADKVHDLVALDQPVEERLQVVE